MTKIKDRVRREVARVPMAGPLLGAFGLVSLLYGFEKLLDRTFLVDQPILMVLIGAGLLLLTGSFYSKL